jgi:TATA-box binding protein (TBP) (component of TFIID and TFIIIB)
MAADKPDIKTATVVATPDIKTILTPLQHSTTTVEGRLSNVNFEEEYLIYAISTGGRIKRLECNYGSLTEPGYTGHIKKRGDSTRGRRPKEKKESLRKKQGDGTCFNSQLTYTIQSDKIPYKVYKIKVFRMGIVHIPGGLDPEHLDDVKSALKPVEQSLSSCFCEDVHTEALYPIMINYKCEAINKDMQFDMWKLFKTLQAEQETPTTDVKIISLKYNPERYPGVIFKFSTPTESNPNKKITIKVFKKTKINIDGAATPQTAAFFYKWMCVFCSNNIDNVLFTPSALLPEQFDTFGSDFGSETELDD